MSTYMVYTTKGMIALNSNHKVRTREGELSPCELKRDMMIAIGRKVMIVQRIERI